MLYVKRHFKIKIRYAKIRIWYVRNDIKYVSSFSSKIILISILFLIHDKYETNDTNLSIDMMKNDIFFCIILFLLE